MVEKPKLLAALLKKLKQSYKPDLSILFGSRAQGDFSRDSDIDLLIVKKTRKIPLSRRVDVRKIFSTEIGLDIFVYSPQEFNQRKESVSPFLKQILEEGKAIYERKNDFIPLREQWLNLDVRYPRGEIFFKRFF